MSFKLAKSITVALFATPMFFAPLTPASATVIPLASSFTVDGVTFAEPSGNCTSSTTPACPTTVNFSGSGSGTTITGDTNPPPVYNVTATSPTTLNGSGSNVGADFLTLTLAPVPGSGPGGTSFAWTAIDFFLDSALETLPLGSTGLTFTAFTGPGLTNPVTSPDMAFPWEGNAGDAQNYLIFTAPGTAIYGLTIQYTAPADFSTNTIADIHNIDVGQVQVVPEPSSLATLLTGGLGLLGIVLWTRRRKQPPSRA